MQARAGQRGTPQTAQARGQIIDLEATASFTLGERVFHQKFGYGAIAAIEADKLEVNFEKAGIKKVLARFIAAAGASQDAAQDDVPF